MKVTMNNTNFKSLFLLHFYEIILYIVAKEINFTELTLEDKEKYQAGSSCWIGINREETFCER